MVYWRSGNNLDLFKKIRPENKLILYISESLHKFCESLGKVEEAEKGSEDNYTEIATKCKHR